MCRNMFRIPTSKLISLRGRKPESHNWEKSRGWLAANRIPFQFYCVRIMLTYERMHRMINVITENLPSRMQILILIEYG